MYKNVQRLPLVQCLKQTFEIARLLARTSWLFSSSPEMSYKRHLKANL